jgi:hypothetical protein
MRGLTNEQRDILADATAHGRRSGTEMTDGELAVVTDLEERGLIFWVGTERWRAPRRTTLGDLALRVSSAPTVTP